MSEREINPHCIHIGKRLLMLILLLAASSLITFVWVTAAAAVGPEDPGDEPAGPGESTITPTPYLSPRQEQPYLPPDPTMADLGHQKWWMVCMACHADAGQGLTDEWRETAFAEDQYCWAAKCHGNNHPPEGFIFPRIVPPAWGSGTLKRFVTANELQRYLYEKMPWWNPGSLTEQEAWDLTAWILQGHGVLPDGELEISRSELIPVHLPVQENPPQPYWQYGLVGVLTLASVGAILRRSLQIQREEELETRSNTSQDGDPKNCQ